LTSAGNDVIRPDTAFRRAGTAYMYATGPVWMPRTGQFIVNDLPRSAQIEWDPVSRSRNFLSFESNKSSGNVISSQGLLVTCQHSGRRVVSENLNTKRITVIADSYRGRKLNGPHDLTITKSGVVYFTDPRWAELRDFGYGFPSEQEFANVFRWDSVNGLVSVDTSFVQPSGIVLSPDESKLYVADSAAGFSIYSGTLPGTGPYDATQPHEIRVFDLENGDLTNGRLFVTAPEQTYPEGMKFDSLGNLWVAYAGRQGRGGIVVYQPDGTAIVSIDFRDNFNVRDLIGTHLAFGGADGRTVMATAGQRSYVFDALVKGAEF